jgi:hypothetical protein
MRRSEQVRLAERRSERERNPVGDRPVAVGADGGADGLDQRVEVGGHGCGKRHTYALPIRGILLIYYSDV